MNYSQSSIALRCALMVAAFAILSHTADIAIAQSDIVFMTADDNSFDSHLHRFDDGGESFAVNIGAGENFQGVTGLVDRVHPKLLQRFLVKGHLVRIVFNDQDRRFPIAHSPTLAVSCIEGMLLFLPLAGT